MLVSFTSHSMAWVSIPLLSCYTVTKSQSYLPGNNSKIINTIPSTVLTTFARWLNGLRCWIQNPWYFHGMGSDPTPIILHCYKFMVLTTKNNWKIINNIPSTVIDYICSMAEWSKVLVTGTFDGMGSDKTPLMLHCYKLTVLAAEKQFENNKQHTFNCTDYICKKAEWSKCAGFSY